MIPSVWPLVYCINLLHMNSLIVVIFFPRGIVCGEKRLNPVTQLIRRGSSCKSQTNHKLNSSHEVSWKCSYWTDPTISNRPKPCFKMSDPSNLSTETLLQLLQIVMESLAPRNLRLLLHRETNLELLRWDDFQPVLDVLVSLLPSANGNSQDDMVFSMTLSMTRDEVQAFISANDDATLAGLEFLTAENISRLDQLPKSQRSIDAFLPIFREFVCIQRNDMMERLDRQLPIMAALSDFFETM